MGFLASILFFAVFYGIMWLSCDRPRLRAVQFVGNAPAENLIKRDLKGFYGLAAGAMASHLLFPVAGDAIASCLMVGAYFLEARIIATSTPILRSNAISPLVDGVPAGLWKGRLCLFAALFQAVAGVSILILPEGVSAVAGAVSLGASVAALFPMVRYWIAIQKHAKALKV